MTSAARRRGGELLIDESGSRADFAELREARDILLAAAAACRAKGLLSAEQLLELRAAVKTARTAKLLGGAAIKRLGLDYAQRAAEFQRRLRSATQSTGDLVVGASSPATHASPGELVDSQTAPARTRRVDELLDVERDELANKYAFVCAVERGVTVRDAVAEADLGCCERTARNYLRGYRQHGLAGLLDGRRNRTKRPPTVMTDEVQKIVLETWARRPVAGPKLVCRLVAEACINHGLRAPRYHSVWRFLDGQPEALKLLRRGDTETYNKRMRPVVRSNLSSKANERFQFDHSQLDMWAKEDIGGSWQPVPVWLSAALDDYSRAVTGIVLSSATPNAWTVALLIRHSILPKTDPEWWNKGIPDVVQPDRGKDFNARPIVTSCAALDIRIDPDPPYYPNGKGKIERWFQTLDTGCMRALPGHKADVGTSEGAARKRINELLTLAEIRANIERWIVHEYHQRTHTGTKATPADRWAKSVALPRMPDNEGALNLLLLQDEPRVVRATGIEFRSRRYWSPMLKTRIGTQVFVRFNPDDLASVCVYCAQTKDFITEANSMGLADSQFGVADVMQARREQDHQWKDLLARMKAGADQVAVRGRSPGEHRRRRRQLPDTSVAEKPTEKPARESHVETLIGQLERRLRSDESSPELNRKPDNAS